MGAIVSILLVLNLIETRASRYAVTVKRIESIEICQGDQEARLRVLERAYNQQVPILTALAEHFGLSP